jgi:hypothetical protein
LPALLQIVWLSAIRTFHCPVFYLCSYFGRLLFFI